MTLFEDQVMGMYYSLYHRRPVNSLFRSSIVCLSQGAEIIMVEESAQTSRH